MVCPVPGSKLRISSQFIAEEIEAHRIDQIAREHIDRAALRTEGSWSIELAGILIAELHQVLDQTLVVLDTRNAHLIELFSRFEYERARNLGTRGCHLAQERSSGCYYQARPSTLKCPKALRDDVPTGVRAPGTPSRSQEDRG